MIRIDIWLQRASIFLFFSFNSKNRNSNFCQIRIVNFDMTHLRSLHKGLYILVLNFRFWFVGSRQNSLTCENAWKIKNENRNVSSEGISLNFWGFLKIWIRDLERWRMNKKKMSHLKKWFLKLFLFSSHFLFSRRVKLRIEFR